MHKALPFCVVALSLAAASSVAAQSLHGSPASIDRMYRQAVQHDLTFYKTSTAVRKAVGSGDLVRLTGNASYRLASVGQPYVLPSTKDFVEHLATQYQSVCGEKMVVTSAVRPKSVHLVNSVDKSVHPTGMAVDLRKPTRSKCLSWLRETLSSLEGSGAIEATEEHYPAHFHVAVFPPPKERAPAPAAQLAAAQLVARSSAAKSTEATYRVRPGDSLWTIARRMNVSIDVIRNANALRSSRIVAGQLLIIPPLN